MPDNNLQLASNKSWLGARERREIDAGAAESDMITYTRHLSHVDESIYNIHIASARHSQSIVCVCVTESLGPISSVHHIINCRERLRTAIYILHKHNWRWGSGRRHESREAALCGNLFIQLSTLIFYFPCSCCCCAVTAPTLAADFYCAWKTLSLVYHPEVPHQLKKRGIHCDWQLGNCFSSPLF